ncbi:MAG: hypothetical protein K9H48_17590 [Melioribacteraceae bacterium]|nr:hypothetical protein [Melioribacteraceae bacterium]MCF8395717.1 hypothetical protein [Melioribacteraceae bacterium]MCF8421211.1 hypothetical protein [Melioribacteraceae bacterium]
MKLAIFTSGFQTAIGIQKDSEAIVKTIDSKFLYAIPEQFDKRLRLTLLYNFNINPENSFDEILFSIQGHCLGNVLIESDLLKSLCFTDGYMGFNFSEKFKGCLKENGKVRLMSNIEALSKGMVEYLKLVKSEARTLILFHDWDTDAAIIENYKIEYLPKELHLSSENLLTYNEIDKLAYEGSDKINIEYSRRLANLIADYFSSASLRSEPASQVYIFTDQIALIANKYFCADNKKLKFIFAKLHDSLGEVTYPIPIIGMFRLIFQPGGTGSQVPQTPLLTESTTPPLQTPPLLPNQAQTPPQPEPEPPPKMFIENVISEVNELVIKPAEKMINEAIYDFNSFLNFVFSPGEKRFVYIEYLTLNHEKVKTFYTFDEFVEHWRQTKPVASPQNYYKFVYRDEINFESSKLAELNTEDDLNKFNF